MYTGQVAAVVGLGACVMLLIPGEDRPESVGSRDWSWRGGLHAADLVTGLLGAADRVGVCIITGVSLLALGWLYRLLLCPLELLRAPDDVGYIAEEGRSKAQAANDVRRRRKTGELPPVYPNGWYRLLDSHMLERGQVRDVSVVGM